MDRPQEIPEATAWKRVWDQLSACAQQVCRSKSPLTTREWRAHFGISQSATTIVWTTLKQIKAEDAPFKLKYLFWTLYFLKTYPTDDVGSKWCGCSQKTFRKWVWRVIFALCRTLNTVICFNNRTVSVPFSFFLFILYSNLKIIDNEGTGRTIQLLLPCDRSSGRY